MTTITDAPSSESVPWHVIPGDGNQIQCHETQLRALVGTGVVHAETPVWTKGMEDWQACGEVHPEYFASQPAGPGNLPTPCLSFPPVAAADPFPRTNTTPEERAWVREFNEPLVMASGWMKLTGWMWIVLGAFSCLTIIGLLSGAIMISIGIVALKAASASEEAQAFGHKRDALAAQDKLRLFFKINGILVLFAATGFVLGLVVNIGRILMIVQRAGLIP